MNRRERLEVAVAGGTPDRVPVSAWGHFYTRETTAAGLAGAMVEFFEEFEKRDLALIYDQDSMFNKIVGRDTAERREQGEHGASRH